MGFLENLGQVLGLVSAPSDNKDVQRLTPEQIKRNIAYSRYMTKRNKERGSYSNMKSVEYREVGLNHPDRRRGALDTGQKPESSMTKRPMQF